MTAAPRTWRQRRRLAIAWLHDRRQFAEPRLPRTCPICGYTGVFVSVGHPPRWDARCLNCGSRERHRLLWLWVRRDGGNRLAGKHILHFAPEKVVMRQMRGNPLYETADLHQSGVTHTVDITNVALPDGSYDVVIANHVLEHIPDDRQAMRELFRLLRPGGMALLTVPLNASRQQTYENLAITAPAQRHAHFSAEDHVRYYGLDFADRLADAGFTVATFRLTPEEEVQFGLLRDEWLYIATKRLASEDRAVEDLAVQDLAVENRDREKLGRENLVGENLVGENLVGENFATDDRAAANLAPNAGEGQGVAGKSGA
jgi:predicted SAM-dependent methyltransferase